MKDTVNDFSEYCTANGVEINEDQLLVAKTLFNMPIASGKTTLVSLLYAYGPSSERVFNNMRSKLGLYPNIR